MESSYYGNGWAVCPFNPVKVSSGGEIEIDGKVSRCATPSEIKPHNNEEI